nr:hypothetical protein 16 [Saccharospirillaceae bacterium]
MTVMQFEGRAIENRSFQGAVWVAASEIARALGYNRSDKVNQIYQRNKDEFTQSMAQTLNLRVRDSDGVLRPRKALFFTLRGAHLIAMFARTEKAKAFRRWVLDILDELHQGQVYIQQQYREATQQLNEAKDIASQCGRGLNQWKQQKTVLENRLEYWEERRQLALSLEVQ